VGWRQPAWLRRLEGTRPVAWRDQVDAHGRAVPGRGVGLGLLRHIEGEARSRGYWQLSLETGSFEAFVPARALYSRYGFVGCGPFGDYRLDPNSVFMTLAL
jgi:putative acetyltransferase